MDILVPWLHPGSGSVPSISSGISFRGPERATLATREQERNKLPHPERAVQEHNRGLE